VRVAGLVIEASGVEVRDMQTRWVVRGTTDVTLRNVRADGPVYIHGASNVSVLGGEVYSPTPVKSDSQISSFDGRVPTNVVLDRVAFHDWVDVGPGQKHHIECLQVGSGIDLTIRNSTFRNCATHDIFVRSWGRANKNPHPLQRVVFENNWFARTNAGYASVALNDDLWKETPTSFLLRNNTALQSFNVDVRNGTASVTGNILPAMSRFVCKSRYGKGYDYNLYEDGIPCGAHDRVGNPRYVDAAGFDLHLRAGSAAIGAGDPDDHPASDIDGDRRPTRTAPDAGADEFDRAQLVVDRAIGRAELRAQASSVVDFYGPPAKLESGKLGGKPVRVAVYSLHGGTLRVMYAGDVVVGLATSSSYYATGAGAGVGSNVKAIAGGKPLLWSKCQRAFRIPYKTSTMFLAPEGGRKGTRVARITIAMKGYDGC
jgi:hypothetical protein